MVTPSEMDEDMNGIGKVELQEGPRTDNIEKWIEFYGTSRILRQRDRNFDWGLYENYVHGFPCFKTMILGKSEGDYIASVGVGENKRIIFLYKPEAVNLNKHDIVTICVVSVDSQEGSGVGILLPDTTNLEESIQKAIQDFNDHAPARYGFVKVWHTLPDDLQCVLD